MNGATFDDTSFTLLNGGVVRSKKPVYWCSTCRTALAEAEVEYYNHSSPSIYVKFPLAEAVDDVIPELAGQEANIRILIWTTTPWTLPSNAAIAVAGAVVSKPTAKNTTSRSGAARAMATASSGE